MRRRPGGPSDPSGAGAGRHHRHRLPAAGAAARRPRVGDAGAAARRRRVGDPPMTAQPIEPADPVEPTDPVEPADPVEPSDPVDPVDHRECAPEVAWTSGNVAEAFPGVCTPLGFSFMHGPVELALRAAFRDIGVFTDAQVYLPDRVEEQFWTAFAGRAAANMDQFRALADLTPGTSATAVERQLFGYVRPGTVDRNSYRRYPR